MIRYYIKYSWFFLMMLMISSVLAYSGFNEMSSYAVQIFYTLCISTLLHFFVFQLCEKFIKNRTVFNALILFVSVNILALNSSFYIGVKNWGSPINIDLVKASISDFSSIVELGLQQIELLILFMIGLLVLYYSFHKNSKRLFPLRIQGENSLTSNLFLLTTFLAICGFIFSYPTVGLTEKKILKEEVYSSFFRKAKDLQRINHLDLGVENRVKSYPVITNFDKKNVILISIDCLRADHLAINGYERNTTPFLSSIKNLGKLKDYTLSTSTCATSFCGIISILNSKNLQGFSYLKYGLHDYLKAQGYKINFILSGVHRDWYNLRKHYGNNIDFYVEGNDKTDFKNTDDALIVDEVKNIENYNGEPNFFFFHFMGPHTLGFKNEEFQKFQPVIDKGILRKLRLSKAKSKDLQSLYTNNYDNGIFQTDHYIKQIFSLLQEKGYMENAIVVITGGHGESLGENSDELGHGRALTDKNINVPILFIENDIAVYKEDRYATQIDIAPTIAKRLQLPIPQVWQGVDLTEKHTNRITYHEQTPHGFEKSHIGVISVGSKAIQKYIIDQNTGDESIFELDLRDNSVDTLDVTETNTSYFRSKIDDYKKDKNVYHKSLEDVRFNSNDTMKLRNDTTLMLVKDCERFTKEMIEKTFKPYGEVFRTIASNKRRKSCTCYYVWKSKNNTSYQVNLEVRSPKNAKGILRSLVRNKAFIKHKKVNKQICYNDEKRSVVWVTEQNKLISLTIEKGANLSNAALLTFAETNGDH